VGHQSQLLRRNTHTYLDLDAGADFDRQIVEENVGERAAPRAREAVLAARAGRPRHEHRSVPAGGRSLRAHARIIEPWRSGTPFSILTKGTLLRRDLPLLRMPRHPFPSIAMSIAVFDDALQQSLEPSTPTAAARLATVRPPPTPGSVTVFLMPILPHLTDSTPLLDDALARIRAAGGARVVFGALHLRPGAKEWFWEWPRRRGPNSSGVPRALPGSIRLRARRLPEAARRACAAAATRTGWRAAPRKTSRRPAAPGPRQDDGRAAGDRLF
jgi:hypothetical protein